MHLDHVSYAASHDSVIDVIQRIGSQLGASFIDGGIHPQFGTRNFILPLKDSRYLEVVCPLDHPAADKTPFGQLVTKKAEAGGGWLTWVVAVDDIETLEKRLKRSAVEGRRTKPNGEVLVWKQIGILDTLAESSKPFFIEWKSASHPSSERDTQISLNSIEIYGDPIFLRDKYEMNSFLANSHVKFNWLDSAEDAGIESITFSTQSGDVKVN